MIDQKNEKQASQGPQVTTQYRLADYNVLAAFNSLDDARGAIEALGRAGIEGKHITLGGDVADVAATNMDTAEADRHFMEHWLGIIFKFGTIGAVAGAVVGVPVGAAAIAATGGDVTGSGLIASAAFGAIGLAIVTTLIAGISHIQAGDTWELTFQETYGDKTIVGVHSSKREDIDKAKQMLETHGATIVRVPSSSATPQEAVDRVAGAAR
jgi:hypothetical protein